MLFPLSALSPSVQYCSSLVAENKQQQQKRTKRALSMVFGVHAEAGVAFLSSKHAPPQ